MSRDLRNTSLASQAAQLKRSLENRDKRRQADKIARLSGKDDEQHAALRGPVVNQSVATLGAISEQHEERQTARCDLCQAEFMTALAYEQHMQSAVHKKAVEKQQAEQARRQRLAESGLHDVADMALGAAAWGTTHDAGAGGARGRSYGPGRGRGGAQVGGRNGPGQPYGRGGGSQSRGQSDIVSHEEMTRSLRKQDEDLSIDGWVPPSVSAPVQPPMPAAQAAPPAAQPPELHTGSDQTDEESSPSASTGDQEPAALPAPGGQQDHAGHAEAGRPAEGGGNDHTGLVGALGLGYDDTSSSDSESSQDDQQQASFEGKSFF